LSMCKSAANIIKVEGTIITFEGGDRADFGQVAEGCVRRAEPDVKDAVGIKQRARVVEPVVSISLRNGKFFFFFLIEEATPTSATRKARRAVERERLCASPSRP